MDFRRMDLNRIREYITGLHPSGYRPAIRALEADPRAGARRLAERLRRELEAIEAEKKRLRCLWVYETKLARRGFRCIAGIDEAGRGPLAGPVVAAAVVLPAEYPWIEGLDDSKALRSARRDRIFEEIRRRALAIGVGMAGPGYIDRHNISRATHKAMRHAVMRLRPRPDYLLVDGFPLPGVDIPQWAIIDGDALSLSIAAASVVAKVTRDRYMERMCARCPGYGFERHKGYATRAHLDALARLGPSRIHRLSYLRGKEGLLPDRRREAGIRGEELAARYLEAQGYSILGRNLRCPEGEIDIVAMRDGVLALVEVRSARSTGRGDPRESVRGSKRRRITRAALWHLRNMPPATPVRFDVITFHVDEKGAQVMEHLEDAFRP